MDKKQLLDKNACVFSMIEKETDDFIGNAEIVRADNNIGKIIISVTPLKQDKHYGIETIKSIIKYGYENIKLDGFELNVYKSNHKAIHCYKKLGFTLADNGYTNEDILMKHKRKM